MRKINKKRIEDFEIHLINEEKSKATVNKYIRDVSEFALWLDKRELNKSAVLEYKAKFCENYKPTSINSVLSSLNSFFNYMSWYDLKVKALKIQKQIFASREKELTKNEYERLLSAAKSNKRLYLVMQTICSTGIRVSENGEVHRRQIEMLGLLRCCNNI